MGYIDIDGRSNGKMRINYEESVNQSAATSTITITSVQVLSTNRAGYSFQPVGTITLGSSTITLSASNAVWVGSLNTWYTFANVTGVSATFPNNGSGQSATISLGPTGSYSDFNIFCYQWNSGNIYINAGARYITLSRYSTDSASSVSAASPVVLGNSSAVTVTASKSTYTHVLQYSLDQVSWYTFSNSVPAGTYYFDTNAIASSFGSATEKVCYIRCTTYLGASAIGSSSTNIRVMAGGSPSVTGLTLSPVNENEVVEEWGVYLQGYTQVSATVTYSLPVGTTLRSIDIYVNGAKSVSGISSTLVTAGALTSSGSVKISAVVTDSRGNTGMAEQSIDVYPYTRPYATLTAAHRYSTSPAVEDKDSGTNISAKATVGYSSVNGRNSVGVRARYKAVGGVYPTSYTTLTSGADFVQINDEEASLEQSYVVQFLIYDDLHPVTADPTSIEITIPTKSVVLHSRDGGKGIAFGGYNLADGVEHYWPTYLHDSLMVDSGSYGTSMPEGVGENGQLYFRLVSSSGGGESPYGTDNYNELLNKPGINGTTLYAASTAAGLGLEELSHKVSSITGSSTDSQYPSAKAVYDLVSQGTGGTFYAVNGVTSYEDVDAAYAGGKALFAVWGSQIYVFNYKSSISYVFIRETNASDEGGHTWLSVEKIWVTSTDGWHYGTYNAELTSNRVTSLSDESTDYQYPSAKCVYDIIGNIEDALAALR